MSKPGYALFDLDQTLVPWDMQLLYANWVFHHYPTRRIYLALFFCVAPLVGLLGARRVKRVFLSILHRMPESEREELNQGFVDHYYPDLFYPETLGLLRKHIDAGDTVVLTSASPSLYVSKLGEKLGVAVTHCTQVECKPKMPLFPQIRVNNKSENKITILKQWLQENGHKVTLPLPNSVGYTDSTADLPLLAATQRAVLVHPSEQLVSATAQLDKPATILHPERLFSSKQGKLKYAIEMLCGVHPIITKNS